MKNLSIKTKIISMCAVLLGSIALCAGMGVSSLRASNQRTEQLVTRNAASAIQASAVRTALAKVLRTQRDFLLASDDQARAGALAEVDKTISEFEAQRAGLQKLSDTALEAKLADLDTAWKQLSDVDKQMRELKAGATNDRIAKILDSQGLQTSNDLRASLDALDKQLAADYRNAPGASHELVQLAREQIWAATSHEKSIIIESSDAAMEKALDDAKAAGAELDRRISELARLSSSVEARRLANDVAAKLSSWRDVHKRVAESARRNADVQSIALAQSKGQVAAEQAMKSADAMIAAENSALESARDSASSAYHSASTLLFVVTAIALVFGVVLAFTIIRHLVRSLGEASRLATAVARGDLTQKAAVVNQDEVGLMIVALNDMVDNLRRVVGDVTEAAVRVASGSEEMSSTSEQVAKGASEQSASTEESTAAMEEMAASVQQNSDNAQQTDRLASKASADAEKSGRAVSDALASVKQIAAKISIIEEIARKTDLLALNAAVEAARAGEHGRGFAVVASEVRKLAERSATAAAEISELSRTGVSLAEGAGEMLTRLVPDIRKTAELVQEVSAASREQTTGIDQTNKALQMLDRVTQQNAAAAEELAASAGELSSQAQVMQSAVAFFKLDDRRPAAAALPVSTVKVPREVSRRIARMPVVDARPKAHANGKPNGKSHGIELELGGDDDSDLFERS